MKRIDKVDRDWRFINSLVQYREDSTLIKSKEKNIVDGEYKEYFGSRKIKSITNFENGVRIGLSKHFYENGPLLNFCKYTKGIKEGLSKTFYSNGDIMYCNFYLNNTIEGEEINIGF